MTKSSNEDDQCIKERGSVKDKCYERAERLTDGAG